MNDRESIHFVTGKLAESALREIVHDLSSKLGFQYTIDVLPITVAALMTPRWLLKHIRVPQQSTRVILPGYLAEGLDQIRSSLELSCSIECGPKDVRDLPVRFGKKRFKGEDYGEYDIEIIAEINYANRMPLNELVESAIKLCNDGADRIDLGCDPGTRWHLVHEAVAAITERQIKVSIDTFDPWEVEKATKAGASLVLSVNRSNRDAAPDWGTEVVVVPEFDRDYRSSMAETVDFLVSKNVPFRLDPILEPIGCGFSNSLGRYLETRKEFPDAPMMMGIGNITELTDADSAPINTLLLGFCEEQEIHSVLTTQVISWARTSVRECDLAKRLVHYAVRHKVPPKHLEERLVILRDPQSTPYSAKSIETLGAAIKDNNYRIFSDDQQLHLVSAGVHIRGTDPFEMMEELMSLPQARNVDPAHAFYLGFELAKALTALTLGKRYEQDEALRWGVHTREERHRRLARRKPNESTADRDEKD